MFAPICSLTRGFFGLTRACRQTAYSLTGSAVFARFTCVPNTNTAKQAAICLTKAASIVHSVWAMRLYNRHVNYDIYDNLYYGPAVGGIKRYRDPSVCLSHGAAALGARLL